MLHPSVSQSWESMQNVMYDTQYTLQQTSMLDITWKATSWVANGRGMMHVWETMQDTRKNLNAAQNQHGEWERRENFNPETGGWEDNAGQQTRRKDMWADKCTWNPSISSETWATQATATDVKFPNKPNYPSEETCDEDVKFESQTEPPRNKPQVLVQSG